MTAKNDITGDLIQTKANSSEYRENVAKIFGDKKVKGGSWVYDPVAKKMVPKREYRAANPLPKRAGVFPGARFEEYQSPIDGKPITNKRQHEYDLESNGCRVYEGRKSEEKEAAKYRQHEDKKLEESVSEGVEQTFYDLKYNRVAPETHINTGWLVDE